MVARAILRYFWRLREQSLAVVWRSKDHSCDWHFFPNINLGTFLTVTWVVVGGVTWVVAGGETWVAAGGGLDESVSLSWACLCQRTNKTWFYFLVLNLVELGVTLGCGIWDTFHIAGAVVWSRIVHPHGNTQKVPCRRRCLPGITFIHCNLVKWEQPKGALQVIHIFSSSAVWKKWMSIYIYQFI